MKWALENPKLVNEMSGAVQEEKGRKQKEAEEKQKCEEEERQKHKKEKEEEEEEKQKQLQWEQFEKMLTAMPSEKVQRLFSTLTRREGQTVKDNEATAKQPDNKASSVSEKKSLKTDSKVSTSEVDTRIKNEKEEESHQDEMDDDVSPFDSGSCLVMEELDLSTDVLHSQEMLDTDLVGWQLVTYKGIQCEMRIITQSTPYLEHYKQRLMLMEKITQCSGDSSRKC